MERCDILIIGAGAAGISAARAAHAAGCRRVLLLDRGAEPGGVLLQCAHPGFGEGLTGPAYARRLCAGLQEKIGWYPEVTVRAVYEDRTALVSGPALGTKSISFQQLILATGCREIPIGALPIAGTRPKGVYTAGQMQALMNLHGFCPEGPVVILGSGDLGLIMAGQLARRGLSVTLVEQRGCCGGMARNQRALEGLPITLLCNTTICEVFGQPQLEGVKTQDGSVLFCRTLLIAVGLRPERALVRGLKSPAWLHLCGNCSEVHPMVEAVVREGEQAAASACQNLRGSL